MRLIFSCLLFKLSIVNISFGYDDISAHKPTEQSTIYTKTDVSQNAVDRSLFTCSTTDSSNPAWWYVDLQKVKSIYDVEIYFRLYGTEYEQRQRERMYGYKLYISNSTDFSLLHEAYLCYSHNGPELPNLNVTHVCVSFGRYVIFYNERIPGVTYPDNKHYTYTQLCEVIVQGCEEDGVYGFNCNETCPTNCQERMCYITNGTCVGCKDGWTGDKCTDACPAGYYGAECRRICSDGCRNNFCNHVTGHCEGCRTGWMGFFCNETCEPGAFGLNCSGRCSSQCVNKSCNYITGFCDYGCMPGWRNDKCNILCSDGRFGVKCEGFCSGNCLNNETCHHVDGHCTHGCQAGFQGGKCDAPCGQGFFGKNCSQKCSVNCHSICNNVNGLCTCNKGLMGRNCSKACSSGHYGYNCEELCSSNCLKNEICNIINGSCPSGCQEDYEGDTCQSLKGFVPLPSIDAYTEDRGKVDGLTAGLVISLLLNVGFCFTKKEK
ncbi:multiple epidermal growth factor-like domains protein 10 isoform X2 [Saccostrea cucullata]|uniref:multiple epidermal growth factor-like domains protein 10 isoform X2 n=1 Tax=Saccostrea cuccullata TaxID=36930 RepID=UPI002ED4CA07